MLWRHLAARRSLVSCYKCLSPLTSPTANMATLCKEEEIIVVTGGSGFLGQHVIHLLQKEAVGPTEIRIFDVKPYKKFLDHEDNKPVTEVIGDICDPEQLQKALRGASTVIHIAGLVSFDTFPLLDEMERVNTKGTAAIIDMCIAENVERLIFCSTVDVVIGENDIIEGDEENTTTPEKFLFPGYPESKHKAEELVLKSNGSFLSNGQKFHTVSLRPNVMYGEGDPFMITAALQSAKDTFGRVVRVGDGRALFQMSYAGNVAWAFLKANDALHTHPECVGGNFFFIPDDTPVQNIFDSLHPYLDAHNFKVTPFSIPYPLLYGLFTIRDSFLQLISSVVKLHMTPLCSISYINMTFTFKNEKAQRLLGFRPIFTPEESIQKSKMYYDSLKLN